MALKNAATPPLVPVAVMPAAFRLFSQAVLLIGPICAALACGTEPRGPYGQGDAGVRAMSEATDEIMDAGAPEREEPEAAALDGGPSPDAAPEGGPPPDAFAPGCEQARSETCNGLDEDCDGRVDEDFDLDGDGRLSRAAGCVAFYPDAELDCDDRFAELGARCPLFVRAAATGEDTGVDWDNAFTDLQAALAIAKNGDEIRMAEGRYTPGSGTLDRLSSFVVPEGVWLRGSYDGTSYDGEAHDRRQHPTVLSGDLLADDALDTERKDNSRHVVQAITRPFSTGKIVIEGVEIRGGHAEGYSDREEGQGGALYGRAEQLELRDCLITDNDGSAGAVFFEGETLVIDGLQLVGNRAGIRSSVLQARAATTILHSEVRDNHSPYGVSVVSISNFATPNTRLPVRIENTRFIDNSSGWESSATLALFSAGTVQISDCDFLRNRGGYGGAAIVQAPTLQIRRATFRDNSALVGYGGPSEGYGGALALLSSGSFASQATLEDVHFEGNRAAYGGAFHAMGPNFTMRSTTFVDNEAAIAGGAIVAGYGTRAAIFDSEFRSNRAGGLGGAWSITADAQVNCAQCVFNGNSVRDGQTPPQGFPDDMAASALWIDTRASVKVTSSAFVNHTFSESVPDSDVEGVITVSSGSFSAVNTVFWGNEPNQVAARVNGKEPATATFSYCAGDLQLVGKGTRTLDASPFAAVLGADGLGGTLDDDLRLRAGSMCIDAGNRSEFVGEAPLDFIGQARFVDDPGTIDVDVGQSPSIDIGPFEYQGI